MSSILEALKKLEKEKLHRNEISTAIASDILRSGNKAKPVHWRIPLILFIVAILVSGLAIILTQKPVPIPVARDIATPSQNVTQPIVVDPVTITQAIPPVQAPLVDLPLLSGIVYQKQAAARMAIINDLPVMEGTIIAGYTLQEIFPDHVTLNRNGQSFSLFIKSGF